MVHVLLCADASRTNAGYTAILNPNPHPLGLVCVGRAQTSAVGANCEYNRFRAHVVGPPRRDVGMKSLAIVVHYDKFVCIPQQNVRQSNKLYHVGGSYKYQPSDMPEHRTGHSEHRGGGRGGG